MTINDLKRTSREQQTNVPQSGRPHWGMNEVTPVMIVVGLLLLVAGLLIGALIGYALCTTGTAAVPSVATIVQSTVILGEVLTASPVPETPTLIQQGVYTVTFTSTFSPTPTSLPPTPTSPPPFEGPTEYGRSANDYSLQVYRLGNGPSARAIIGGIHGGYEWNTVELVSETLKYLLTNQQLIPPTVTLYIIPCANPDGYAAGTDAIVGRMNGNGVDLNRNWGYEWQPTATHGTRLVEAGAGAFSERETDALRRLIEKERVELVVFYHSAMGGVVFSGAEPEKSATFALAEMLSRETGYRHQTEGVPGQITTGDAIDWLSAKMGIAGAEIELTTHDSILGTEEFQRNLRGILAFLEWPIPAIGQETFTVGAWEPYPVQDGDTLWGIAGKFGIEIGSPRYEAFISMNQIDDPNQIIQAGQVLTIPLESEDD